MMQDVFLSEQILVLVGLEWHHLLPELLSFLPQLEEPCQALTGVWAEGAQLEAVPHTSLGAKEVFEPQMFLFCIPECGIAYYPPSQYLLPTLESDGGGSSVDGVDRTVEKYLEEESEWQVRLPGVWDLSLCSTKASHSTWHIILTSVSFGIEGAARHSVCISFLSWGWCHHTDTSQGIVSILESSGAAKGQG